MKRVAALLLLGLLPCVAGPEAFGREDVREVRVRVLADAEAGAEARWTERATSLMEAVSREFERRFGIRLAVASFGEWAPDAGLGSMEQLVDSLDATASKEGCDVVVALTARKRPAPDKLGYSLFKEGLILVDASQRKGPGLERVLLHEWGHMFGAVHVADPASIMNERLTGGEFDALNARLIRLSRNRTFDGIAFPIPKEARKAAAGIYRKIHEANLKALATGRPSAAGGRLRQERRADLDDAPFLLAQIHMEEREYEPALAACRAALELNPGNLETKSLMGIIARRQGRIDEAIAAYERVLEEKPRSPRVLFNMGIAYARKGAAEKAMELYLRAVELKPNFAEAWNNIGDLNLRADRVEEAEAAFLKALSFNEAFALARSNLAKVYINIGQCCYEEGDLPGALALFAKAVELAPHMAEARAGLGYALLSVGRIDEGVTEIRLARELGLVSAKTHVNLSYAFLMKDQPDAAAEEALRAIAIDPALGTAHNNLGISYARQGMYPEAVEAFGKALELEPDGKDARANLAGLLMILGKRREALDHYRRAVNLDPNDGVLHNNIAVLCYQEGAYEEAWGHAQRALALGAKVDPGFLEALREKRRSAGCLPRQSSNRTATENLALNDAPG